MPEAINFLATAILALAPPSSLIFASRYRTSSLPSPVHLSTKIAGLWPTYYRSNHPLFKLLLIHALDQDFSTVYLLVTS